MKVRSVQFASVLVYILLMVLSQAMAEDALIMMPAGETREFEKSFPADFVVNPADRANVHRRVLNELRQQYVATGRMTLGAWRALNELRELRQIADYELSTRVRLRHVNRAVSLFTQFADECYQILGVS